MTVVSVVTLQGGLSGSGADGSGVSTFEVVEAIASGLACTAGRGWLACVVSRRIT
jgi:hypothetical protein